MPGQVGFFQAGNAQAAQDAGGLAATDEFRGQKEVKFIHQTGIEKSCRGLRRRLPPEGYESGVPLK